MRKPWSRSSFQGLAIAVLAGALAWAGCSGEDTVTDPPAPETGPALVSDPVAFGQADFVAPRQDLPATLAGLVDFSFTAFLPREYPGGETVEILNQRTGDRLSAPMLEGGLDPIGIPAQVGDVLEISVLQGQALLARMFRPVPERKPPVVVRTQPPNGKTKVPLNLSITVVFSEPIDGGSVTAESFGLLRDGVPVIGELHILDGGLRAEFTPDEELLRSTEYTITLSTDVGDLSGDALEADYAASFVTDNPPLLGRIVFEDRTTGIGEIYFMNPDGTGVVQVTDQVNGGWSVSPAVSADGTMIAFSGFVLGAGGGFDEEWEIYTINVDGTGLRNLTNHPAFDGWRPAWSPDGQLIAFFSLRDGNDEIYTIGADGTYVRRLTNSPADDANPAWSPDGSKIAFVSNRTGDFEIWVMETDGSNPVQITADPADDDWPSWSPDGSKIAFTSDRSGNRGIWVMNADGTSPTLLVENNSTTATWSPDGSWIAFDRGGSLYIMNADGSNVQRVRSGMFPFWGP